MLLGAGMLVLLTGPVSTTLGLELDLVMLILIIDEDADAF
jgi:hypothetical protein